MIRTALGQLNLTVGDIQGNLARCTDALTRARSEGAQILVLPELAITGYPPEDLLLKQSFLEACRDALGSFAAETDDIPALIGFVESSGGSLYNSAALCVEGRVKAVYRKHRLPNYGVFDERRYFSEGDLDLVFDTGTCTFGVAVCEDVWASEGPIATQGTAGAEIIFILNASPFHKGKVREREALLAERAREAGSTIVYVNLVGGQDELVFDGASTVVSAEGDVLARLPQFQEAFEVIDVPASGRTSSETTGAVERVSVELPEKEGASDAVLVDPLEGPAEVYSALRLSLADYARKNGFSKVLLGLSGGIDSTLTAVIAADAVGADNVLGVTMPSGYSSTHSVEDSKELAGNLGMAYLEIPIASAYDSLLGLLEEPFGEQEMGVAEENLQARIRGMLLMTISNRYGHLVLTTGNKSEVAVGYATLYGDMAGGFALLKDLFKMEVYELSRYRNTVTPVIPQRVISKAPSAELRPDQKDEDSLPPYPVLDRILEGYIEHDLSVREIATGGIDDAQVREVIGLVDRAEYKRRQSAPGPKVTTKAFGRDRRLPITNLWREPEGRASG